MKHNVAVFFRFLAVFAVVFCGITAILPQSTVKDDEAVMPVWTDVTQEDSKFVRQVFVNGLMYAYEGGAFGAEKPFTSTEAAYAAVKLYEKSNGKSYSFKDFNTDESKTYIDKAIKYGVWSEKLPQSDMPLSREQIAEVLAPFVSEPVAPLFTEFANSERMALKDSVLKLYSLGVTLSPRINMAFSPDIELTRLDAARIISMYADPTLRTVPKVYEYDKLKTELTNQMSGWQGDWSLYFEDYDTGAVISINSHQVYSASLIKLFVAQTAYQKIAEGTLSPSAKIDDEIRKMITYSDNEAWKYMARALGGGSYSRGMAAVTDIAKASGFADTGQFYQGSHKNFNFTSVNDCGAFLRQVLDGNLVSKEYSDKLLSLLKQQQHRHKIPAGVPAEVKTANKTGELDYVQGDAAIVYAPASTYILVIIGDSLENGYGVTYKITDLSKTVYAFINN